MLSTMSKRSWFTLSMATLLLAGATSASATISNEVTGGVVLWAGGGADYSPASAGPTCNNAVLTGASAYTPVAGGELNGNIGAYDAGALIGVNEKGFQDLDASGTYDDFDTTYGYTFKPGRQKIGKLQVTRTDSALGIGPVLRSLVTVRNPSKQRVRATLTYQSNLGSDLATVVRYSPFALVNDFEEGDGWVVTADSSNDGALDDPVILTVIGGPSSKKPIEVGSPIGNGCLTAFWRFRIPPQSSRSFVFFNEMHTSGPLAQTSATTHYAPLHKDYLKDIPKSARDGLINWKL